MPTHTAGTDCALVVSTNEINRAFVWCDLIRPSRGENWPSGGVDNGLEPVHAVAGNASQL